MINWLSFGLESSSQASKLILTNTNSLTGGKLLNEERVLGDKKKITEYVQVPVHS